MKLDCIKVKASDREYDFHYRESSVGDRGVIEQIFTNSDYKLDHWHQGRALFNYYNQQSESHPCLIVDAGANIGASALYFLNTFKKSFLFTIEPEINNWHILEINTVDFDNKFNMHGAIAEQDGELTLVDPGLSDWGFRVTNLNSKTVGARKTKTVKSISPVSVLNHPECQGTVPLLFKVDIEGAEELLFRGDTSWMNQFPCLIIELHDWMLPFSGSSRNFLSAVAKYDFDFIHRGENIFLFNRAILTKYL